MYATIQKWGNSQAIRLPKGILEVADLHENDRVELETEQGRIIIKRIGRKHKSLEERLAGYTSDFKCQEWDTGGNRGKEV